jgi:membrane associated rhomboid family serine protease
VLLYPFKISAVFVVGFWFILQLLAALLADPNAPGVAFWAHVGGFGAGLLLTPLLSRIPLFGRHRPGPWG